jgi:ornithine cyclodeaminase
MPEYDVAFARDGNDFLDCELIVTTTPSSAPVLKRVSRGAHITAVGADSPHKRELASEVSLAADLFVVDSLEQCRTRGELHHVVDTIDRARIAALGDVVSGAASGRTSDDEITIADLTGVAVQDIQIATSVLSRLQT